MIIETDGLPMRSVSLIPAPRADAAVRAEVTAVTRPPLSGGTRHTAAFPHARQAPRWLDGAP